LSGDDVNPVDLLINRKLTNQLLKNNSGYYSPTFQTKAIMKMPFLFPGRPGAIQRLFVILLCISVSVPAFSQETWTEWKDVYPNEQTAPNIPKVRISFSFRKGSTSFFRIDNELNRAKAFLTFKFDFHRADGSVGTQNVTVNLSETGVDVGGHSGSWFSGVDWIRIYDIKLDDYNNKNVHQASEELNSVIRSYNQEYDDAVAAANKVKDAGTRDKLLQEINGNKDLFHQYHQQAQNEVTQGDGTTAMKTLEILKQQHRALHTIYLRIDPDGPTNGSSNSNTGGTNNFSTQASQQATANNNSSFRNNTQQSNLEQNNAVRERQLAMLDNVKESQEKVTQAWDNAIGDLADMVIQNMLRKGIRDENAKRNAEFAALRTNLQTKKGALSDCRQCNGNGYTSCKKCEGTGKETCSACYGLGKTISGNVCPGCKGTGKSYCMFCNGTGKYFCATCSGTGKMFKEDDSPEQVSSTSNNFNEGNQSTQPNYNIPAGTYSLEHMTQLVKEKYIKSLEAEARGDHAEAEGMFKAGAAYDDDGNILNDLAVMFYTGNGVNQDFNKSFKLLQKCAQLNNHVAQRNIGALYESGEGVSKDIQQAKYWYQKAAAGGNKDAKAALDRLQSAQGASANSNGSENGSGSNKKIFVYESAQGKSYYKSLGDKEWGEFSYGNANPVFRFQLVRKSDVETILYDASRNVFVRITNNEFFWGNTENDINKRLFSGSWIDESSIDKVLSEKYIVLPSGVKYVVIKRGSGNRHPTLIDKVKTNYDLTYENGELIDNTYKRGVPAIASIKDMVRGLQEVIVLMSPGDDFKIYIPKELALDPRYPNSKPPAMNLVMDIQLEEIQ
jgi:peptidylprolyl isomerase